MNTQLAGTLFAITTGLCWGCLSIGLKYALNYGSSGTIVWVRMVVAWCFLFLGFLYFKPQQLKVFKSPPLIMILAGLCLSCNYFGFMKGVELTTASNAQIMIQMAPMMLLVIGVFFFKETPSRQQAAGIVTAITGFGLFYWDQILQVSQDPQKLFEGNVWILIAAVTWAIFATLQKLLSRHWTPQQINLVIFSVCSFTMLPLVSWQEFNTLSPSIWGLYIFLGLNTIIAYGCLGEALKRIPASHVSLIVACNPLLTLILVYVLHKLEWDLIAHEPIDWRGLLGALCVILGVSLGISKEKSATPKPS